MSLEDGGAWIDALRSWWPDLKRFPPTRSLFGARVLTHIILRILNWNRLYRNIAGIPIFVFFLCLPPHFQARPEADMRSGDRIFNFGNIRDSRYSTTHSLDSYAPYYFAYFFSKCPWSSWRPVGQPLRLCSWSFFRYSEVFSTYIVNDIFLISFFVVLAFQIASWLLPPDLCLCTLPLHSASVRSWV